MTDRTNLSESPTMQRAIAWTYDDDYRIGVYEAEREHPFYDEHGWRDGQDAYEAQLAKQWGET